MFGKIIFISVLGLCRSTTVLDQYTFSHKAALDNDLKLRLLWTPTDHHIMFQIEASTLGFVSFGFSPSGSLMGADLIIGAVYENGSTFFRDYHGVGNEMPVLDSSQDYTLLGSFKNATHTIIRFSRTYLTCDSSNDLEITDDTMIVIWAYSDDAMPTQASYPPYYGQNRGQKSMYLLTDQMLTEDQLQDFDSYIDFTVDNLEAPKGLDTFRWCRLFKYNITNVEQQVIGYRPIITAGNEGYVHHITLNECYLRDSVSFLEHFVGLKGSQCYGSNMPSSFESCRKIFIKWGPGSEGDIFPEDVGFPLGSKYGGSDYFLLEIHYDLPLKDGIKDSSGVRLLVTDEARQHKGGILAIGHATWPTLVIPPGRRTFYTGHCSSACTKETFPEGGIQVFGVLPYMHVLGKQIVIKHIRNDKELSPLLSDKSYDFHHQQMRLLRHPLRVEPSDHLVTICTYDSTRRNKTTYGGLSSNDETCMTFLQYYPRIPLQECTSEPYLETVMNALGVKRVKKQHYMMRSLQNRHHSKLQMPRTPLEKKLNFMKKLRTESLDTRQMNLYWMLKEFIIELPSAMKDKTLLDVFDSPSTWSDASNVVRFNWAIEGLATLAHCLTDGAVQQATIPRFMEPLIFESYEPQRRKCTPLYNQGTSHNTSSSNPDWHKRNLLEEEEQEEESDEYPELQDYLGLNYPYGDL